MKIYDETQELYIRNTAVTLGKFNALHKGHQKLIKYICEEKEKKGCETVLFSFDTSNINNQKLIVTKEERATLCERLGIDHVIFYPVNKKTMAIEPERFIEDILVEALDVRTVVTGQDFCFGRDRQGNVDMLKEYGAKYGFEVIVAESVEVDNTKVSSSKIKEYLMEGLIDKANEMLGYDYFIMGKVSEGKRIGRTIGTRTINITPPGNKILPKKGVYKTTTWVNGKSYKSITNIGTNPTVKSDDEIVVETHIFDFDKNIYDEYVKIQFEKFIREEKKFEDLEALKSQIALDISQANL
jgi:riboflavin kinase/FMN adenylyltransferase